nr:reverse transcriptase domain-containing protein [Tanacetum cinerariifolium]
MNTASTSGSGPLPGNTIANPKGKLKAITTRSGLVLDGPSIPMPPPFINLEEDERVEETLADPEVVEYTIKKMLNALLSNKKLLKLANTPLNENCSAVILKKLPKKLGDPGKFLIPCAFSELKCKALADLVGESSPNPTSSNPKRRNRRRSKQPFILEEFPVDMMADQRTMAELLRALTEGYAEAIVVSPILAEHFELKHSLINMMTSDQFFRLEKDNPRDHIRWFNKITSTIKYKDVPNSVIKLMLFPFSLAGAARRWLEKEPSRCILTWEDLVPKFINELFPPSRKTNLRNEISNFQQRFDESFHEAWHHYKGLLYAYPHHGFTELHQLDTFYNALNPTDQDSMNSAAGGNLLERRTRDLLTIIENKSRTSLLKQSISKQMLTTAMTAILKQFQATPPSASVKAVEEIYITCGGAHPYYQFLAADGNTFSKFQDNIQGYVSAAAVNYTQGNSGYRPPGVANQIRPSGFAQANVQNNQNRFSQPQGYNRGNNFNQDSFYQAPIQQNQCKALADLGASINLMPLSVWKKLGLPKLISTRMTLELANRAIFTPAGIARDVFVSVGKLTFLADFVIVDYKSDPIVPLILGRPFLRTALALIDVHREEMILRDGDERLTLNMRHDTSSYSNQPQKESINMINIYDDSCEDYLEDLFATNHLSGNPTFSSHTGLTSPEVKDDIFDPERDIEMDSILEDSIDEYNLTDPNVNLFDTIPKIFTDEHTLDYSSPLLYDEYDDDLVELESENDDAYNDPFNSKEDKIKESKLLIDKLDLPRSSDFLPSPEYDSFLFKDFSEVDALPSTNNEDKVFNSGILIHKNLFEVTVQATPDKDVKKIYISHVSLILEDFNPHLYELPFHKVLGSENLISYSSENEEKVFKPRILTSKGVHTSLLP